MPKCFVLGFLNKANYNKHEELDWDISKISFCLPDTWPHTRIPKVAAKPKAKLTVRNIPWVPPLNTSWATAPQPNIWRERQ